MQKLGIINDVHNEIFFETPPNIPAATVISPTLTETAVDFRSRRISCCRWEQEGKIIMRPSMKCSTKIAVQGVGLYK